MTTSSWHDICHLDDLIPDSGVAALCNDQQAAIFYVPNAEPPIYALDNYCPCAESNVLYRGIVGDINGELVVASPLYKEHFRLVDGQCIEKAVAVNTWPIKLENGRVLLGDRSARHAA